MKQYKKLVKYLRGTAEVLNQLAIEIEEAKKFDKESEELMSKVGSHLLFNAKTYDLLEREQRDV